MLEPAPQSTRQLWTVLLKKNTIHSIVDLQHDIDDKRKELLELKSSVALLIDEIEDHVAVETYEVYLSKGNSESRKIAARKKLSGDDVYRGLRGRLRDAERALDFKKSELKSLEDRHKIVARNTELMSSIAERTDMSKW